MNPILHSFVYALDYLRELIADVSDADLAAQPAGIANHPAWVIGHLTVVSQEIGGAIGLAPWLPENFPKRFGTGSLPVANASAYDTKENALGFLRDAQTRLIQAVEQLDDAQLDAPFPDPAYYDVFPTIRHALAQVLVAHTAYHVGQVAAWRRALGLARIGRSFE